MNKHIESYLDYFIGLKSSPDYSLLLRGNWGVGKTWFINNYLNKRPEVKCLYVSLNGISSFHQIEDTFFQQLHPLLASKGMKIAGKILKGLLKTTIKIDIDGDSKEDTNISSTLPELNIPDYFKNLDSRILIFDDLERCSLSIPTTLGYINQFVEIQGLKVVILGNENEIIRRENDRLENDSIKYIEIKEKVVGKSFDIKSDIMDALDHFIRQTAIDYIIELLKTKKSIIINLFNIAGYGNLRHLKQSIFDFSRFYEFLPVITKSELIDHIIELFFCISFELKKGTISEDEIPKLFIIDWSAHNKDDVKTIEQILRGKYFILTRYYHPLDYNLLTSFFKYGIMDKEQVNTSISNSSYYQEENTPNWMKLWHYLDLNDDQFESISRAVISDFNEQNIQNKHTLLQVSGLLFVLAERNLIPITKQEILFKSKSNIDNLKNAGLLKKEKNEEFPSYDSNGLSIQGKKTKEFRELFQYAKDQVANALNESYSEKVDHLLDKLLISISEFEELVTLTNSENNLYFDVPIFTYIPISKFINVVLKLENKNKRKLCRIFDQRYRHIQQFTSLYSEFGWLAELSKNISEEKSKSNGKVSGIVLELFLSTIENIINKNKVA